METGRVKELFVPSASFKDERGGLRSLKMALNERYFAYETDDGAVIVRETGAFSEVSSYLDHEDDLTCFEFSRDARFLATTSEDKSTRVYDMNSRKCVKVLTDHEATVNRVRFSKDGSMMATASNDKTIRVYDTTTWGSRVFQGHQNYVYTLEFSDDGRHLVSLSLDDQVIIWDVKQGVMRYALDKNQSGSVELIEISDNNRHLAVLSEDNMCRVWDIESGALIACLPHPRPPGSVVWVKGKNQLITGCSDFVLRLWDIDTGKCLLVMQGHESYISEIRIEEARGLVASSAADFTIRIWDLHTGENLQVLRAHGTYIRNVDFLHRDDDLYIVSTALDDEGRVWKLIKDPRVVAILHLKKTGVDDVGYSPDHNLLSISQDKEILFWDINTGTCVKCLGPFDQEVTCRFIPHSNFMLFGLIEKPFEVWNARTFQKEQVLQNQGKMDKLAAISENGTYIALSYEDCTISLWRTSNLTMLGEFKGHSDQITSLKFSKDEKVLISTSKDRTAILWEIETMKWKVFQGHENYIDSLSIVEKTNFFITGEGDKLIIWDFNGTKKGVIESQSKGEITAYASSRDGKYLWVAEDDYTARIYYLPDLRLIATADGHTSRINCIAFSEDGTKVLTSGGDNFVRMWEATTGKLLHQFTGHTDEIEDCFIMKKTTYFCTVSLDLSIRIWNLRLSIDSFLFYLAKINYDFSDFELTRCSKIHEGIEGDIIVQDVLSLFDDSNLAFDLGMVGYLPCLEAYALKEGMKDAEEMKRNQRQFKLALHTPEGIINFWKFLGDACDYELTSEEKRFEIHIFMEMEERKFMRARKVFKEIGNETRFHIKNRKETNLNFRLEISHVPWWMGPLFKKVVVSLETDRGDILDLSFMDFMYMEGQNGSYFWKDECTFKIDQGYSQKPRAILTFNKLDIVWDEALVPKLPEKLLVANTMLVKQINEQVMKAPGVTEPQEFKILFEMLSFIIKNMGTTIPPELQGLMQGAGHGTSHQAACAGSITEAPEGQHEQDPKVALAKLEAHELSEERSRWVKMFECFKSLEQKCHFPPITVGIGKGIKSAFGKWAEAMQAGIILAGTFPGIVQFVVRIAMGVEKIPSYWEVISYVPTVLVVLYLTISFVRSQRKK